MKRHAASLAVLFSVLAAPLTAATPRLRFEETAEGGVYLAGRLLPDTQISATEMRPLAGGPTLRFVGMRHDALLAGEDALPGMSHDLRNATSSARARDLHHFARLRVHDAWPGIDIVHREGDGALEHDFVVAAGASASRIRVAFSSTSELQLLDDGTLVAQGAGGELRLKAPIAWQQSDTGRDAVACAWRVRGGRATFAVGDHDASRELTIDPELAWSTYMGGSGNAAVTWVGLGEDGSVLVNVSGAGQPTTPGAYSDGSGLPLRDEAVTRLSPDGSTVLWSTYLPVMDSPRMLRLGDGSIVAVSGGPAGRPVVGGRSNAGGTDGYVVILSADGSSLLAAGYFGGPENDNLDAVARAANGDFILGGSTEGAGFEADVNIGPPDGVTPDGLILRVSADLSTVLHSTRIGGTGIDAVYAVAVAPADDGIVAVFDASPDFPTVNAAQPSAPAHGASCHSFEDAAVARLSSDGTSLLWSTFIAGGCDDTPLAVTVDAAGEIAVVGRTDSTDFPIVDAWQAALAGMGDLFVARLGPMGNLISSTYFGGAAQDGWGWSGDGAVLDSGSRLVIVGQSQSSDFPRRGAVGLPADTPASAHATVTRFDIDGGLEFSTTLGGDVPIWAGHGSASIAASVVAEGDQLLLGGVTFAADFPTTPGGLHETAPVEPAWRAQSSGFVTNIGGTLSRLSEVSAVELVPASRPLTIREQGPRLVLGWEETQGGPQDANSRIFVYVGTLGSLHFGRYDHEPATPCNFLMPPGNIEMPPGNVYFLVARGKDDESSLGRDSFGRERPHARTPCP